MDQDEISSYLRSHEKSIDDYYAKKFIRMRRYNPYMQHAALRGMLSSPKEISKKTLTLSEIIRIQRTADENKRINTDMTGLRCLEEAIRCVRSRNIKLVFLYLPSLDVSLNSADKLDYTTMMDALKKHSAEDPGVIVADSLKASEGRHDLFMDAMHVNVGGMNHITDEVIRILRNSDHR